MSYESAYLRRQREKYMTDAVDIFVEKVPGTALQSQQKFLCDVIWHAPERLMTPLAYIKRLTGVPTGTFGIRVPKQCVAWIEGRIARLQKKRKSVR